MNKTIEQTALEQIGTYDCPTCPPHYKVAAEFALAHCKEVVAERDRLREWVNGRKSNEIERLRETTDGEWIYQGYAGGLVYSGKTPLATVEAYLKDKATGADL